MQNNMQVIKANKYKKNISYPRYQVYLQPYAKYYKNRRGFQ